MTRSHLWIPDTQEKPGRPSVMGWIANYAIEKRPDVIVHAGDHWDFPSLSDYETSTTKVAEARDVLEDIEAGNEGMRLFNERLRDFNRSQNHRRRYKPKLILLRGNHDGEQNGGRVHRALKAQPWLKGFFRLHPMESPGWEVVPFLVPHVEDGIAYCHLFARGPNGLITSSKRHGQPSAKTQAQREARSATAGHRQGLDSAIVPVGGGRMLRGLIAGSCYLSGEEYLTPQGNAHWHGVILKRDVRDGFYELVECSLEHLRRKYS